jgi:hypothetical protein
MINVGKNLKKAAAYMLVLSSILSGGAFVYAQFSDSAYQVRTVHIFPSQIEAKGWKNVSTLSFQNLDEYALLQEFNTINSATFDLSTGALIRLDQEKENPQTESPDFQSVENPVITNEASTTQEEVQSDTAATSSLETEVEFDFVIDESPVEDIQTSVTTSTEEAQSDDESSVSQDEQDTVESNEEVTATTTVLRQAQSVFKLAMTAITSVFSASTTDQDPQESEGEVAETETEPEVVEDVTGSTTPAESESTTSESIETDSVETVEQVVPPATEVVTEVESAPASTPSEQVVPADVASEDVAVEEVPSDQETESYECTDDCKPFLITLSDFGFPIEESAEVTGAQLRMSFAAQKKSYKDEVPAFAMRYSMDGGISWSSGGSVIVEDEVSNSINGGYFLFALPEVSDASVLDSLQVELGYRGDPSVLKELFVESVWLELFTLEAPQNQIDRSDFEASLLDDGYATEVLTGDSLELPDGKVVDFDFTDENEGETLIIKSDKKDYVGLTETTTYFSVTNAADRADEFSLQTYFPRGVGEVKSVREYNQNKERKVTVPEYRPFVYHCEAGWDFVGDTQVQSVQDLSKQFVEIETSEEDSLEVDEVSSVIIESEQESELDSEPDSEIEFSLPKSEELTPELDFTAPTNTTTTVSLGLPSISQLLQFSTTTAVESDSDTEGSVDGDQSDSIPSEDIDQEEVSENSYSCRNTNVVRSCDSIDGDNTACHVEDLKVAEHEVTQFAPGWDVVAKNEGALPKSGILRRVAEFIGFGPERKKVQEGFEVRTHTQDEYTIKPGETKYFEMTISFPPFSTGEYWIEAVGNREYGLLDPFWSSQWRYRIPIEIDNLNGATSTEQQVFLEMDSSQSDFWTNVQSDGGDVRFVTETGGDNASTWYNQNWSSRTPIVIDSSLVDADLTDFPVYVDLSDLGSDFFSDVQSGGEDIRITSDDFVTELPYELVDIDTVAETGELHFKASSISSATGTTFYIYYGNGAAAAYAVTDTYGAENVWGAEHIAVYHLEEEAAGRGNADLYQDSTTNEYDADDELNSTGKTGLLGKGQEISAQGVANEYMLMPSDIVNSETELTFSYWMNSSTAGNQALINGGAGNEYLLYLTGGGTNLQFFPGSSIVISDLSNSTWKHVVVSRDTVNNQWRIFVDGQEDDNSPSAATLSTLGIPANCLVFGLEQDSSCLSSGDTSQHLQATIDEVRFRNDIPSDAYIVATYENQSTPSSFYSTSTVESFTQPTFVELDYWIQHFDSIAQESDIWVQLDEMPGSSTSTIYVYYGNTEADTTSDEYAPFTYSTSTDLYYVVSSLQTNPIVVYSLIDDNEVSIDGGTAVTLQSGETTSFSTYSSSSVISALGPITAKTNNALSEPPVPISFATTTNLVTTNRTSEVFYVHSPFADATADVYAGASGVPAATGVVSVDTTRSFAVNLGGGDSGILESDEPVLLFHSGTNDSYVAYPPTLRDIYGIYSNQYNFASINGGTSVEVYCSGGANGTTTGMTRGGEEGSVFCTSASNGLGDAVRLTSQTDPIAATQEADGDGGESSRFLPTPEFGTRYIVPQDTEYVSIACAPRFGTVNIEVQSAAGATLESGSCTPAGEHPGALNFTAASVYSQGSQIVSTNNEPFYLYYEEDANGDETNTWSAVQAKKFNSLYIPSAFGAEEENEDAQYEQLNYRWYENVDAGTPTTAWDIDGTPVAEGAPIIDQGAINPGDELRLRMNLLAFNGTGTVDSAAFTLQYSAAEVCSSVPSNSWVDLADVGSTTAAFAGLNNASVGDGSEIPSTLLSNSDIKGTYEEENNSALIPNEVGNGEAIEFDWSITPVTAVVNSEYCFRLTRSTGDALTTYTSYPQLLTAGPPEVPFTTERFDNEHATSATPTLEFAAVDQGGDLLDYQVQISTDKTFASTVQDRRSDVNFFDFENVNNTSDKSPFDNGALIRFTPQSALTNGVTYWWRVRAIDPLGSNTFGGWTTEQSFTVDTAGTVSEWFQTTDEQFETNSLTNATTSGSDSVELALAGSNLIGEYGSVSLTNGATSTVTLTNSYTNPVVVASIRYAGSVTSPNQPAARVFNKASGSFDVKADNFSNDATGSSVVDYVVMEAGDYLMDDGGDGLRVYATSTSVSAIAGSTIPTDPGGLDIVFPTSFSAPPAVMTMVTTINDPQWVLSSVYDGNDISNPPTAAQVSVFLNDNLDSNGHGSAEDIDIVAFDIGDGSNNSVAFDTLTTAVIVDEIPETVAFSPAFSSTPGVTLVQSLTTNGAQGGYAHVDIDTPATASNVTVRIEEGGSGADRNHADEIVAIVAFENASGNILRAGTAQVVSTPIDFDDADVGNAWGEVSWSDTGDVTYFVEYQTGSGFQLIPDADLPGNSTGFTGSSTNILDLDTSVYNELRLVADLQGVDPEIYHWSVTWGQRVDIPELGDPFDNEKTADRTPVFDFITTDPEGQDLEYEISISTDPTFAGASTTINSTASSSDFSNPADGGDSSPFNSGDRIFYTLPLSIQLNDNETYWWRVRAKDPLPGNDSFSPWSEPDNFTVDTSVTLSTWFQTTQAQFIEGEIDGVIASTSDSIELTDEIAEYGSLEVSANSWTTIDTELSYQDMVVVGSPAFSFNSVDNGRTVQVRNKTRDSFEIRAENDTESLSGTTTINYLVIESGDWLLDNGAAGVRVLAGTAEDVSEVESSAYNGGGTTVTFSPAFATAPEAILTISSDSLLNNSQWVGTAVSAGGAQGTEITVNNMDVAMGVSRDLNTTRVPEDIDYLVFETGVGENNSVLFDALRGTGVTNSDSSVNFNQTFTAAPGVILVHNNANDGADGGFAQVDEDVLATNTNVNLSISEKGDGAGTHAAENVSILAFEASAGTVNRDDSVSGGLSGTIGSEPVLFSDGFGPKFSQAIISATTLGNSTTSVQIQYQTATGSWALIPDVQVSNNSIGNTGATIDLTNVDVAAYPVIRMFATLSCSVTNCPTLDDWAIEWSEGVTMTGTLKEYDRLSDVANATVTVSVNGAAPSRVGTVTAGVWSISNVTAFAGDTVTVFVDGVLPGDVPDANEAVAVFVYDGTGDMTGVELFEGHLSLSSDELSTSTIAMLGNSDNGLIGDEDVFFDVDGSNNLTVCAVGVCPDANLYVGTNNIFVLGTTSTQILEAHDLVNDGVIELDANTVKLSGSWDNNNTVSVDTSTVVFNASTGAELIEDSTGTTTFNNVTFGESSGTATWQPQGPLDINGNLSVNYGTLDHFDKNFTVAGTLTTDVNGFWTGNGTTTFDGSGSVGWVDNNPVSQNIGNAVIDGSVLTVNVGSDVLATNITIGANDTLNGGGAYDIQFSDDFTNNNVFVPSTSRLVVVGTSPSSVITSGGSNLYAFRASTTVGTVSFVESTVTLLDNFEIASGTVNLPTTLLRVGGSFSNTGGDFVHNNAEVRFTGTGVETISLMGTNFLNSFYDVLFNGSGDWTFLDAAATTTNTWTQTSGAVTLPSGELTIGRDFTTTAPGSFDANGGEVIFLIEGSDSVLANGSAFNDVTVRQGSGGNDSWYFDEWEFRVPITIRSSEIDDDLTNFPVYVDMADFSSTFFGNLNSDGSDIRVTQSDGQTELAREIVSASTTAETGELYFQASALSSTTDTTFYLYYGNATATDYAVTDTYGAENVWSNGFVLVAHMNDLTTSTILNSANGSLNGTKESTNNPTETTTGKIYEAQDSSADHIAFGNLGGGSTNITIEAWFNSDNLNPGGGDPNTYGQTIFSAHSAGSYTWVTAGGTGGGGSPSEARFCAFDSSATCDVSSGAGLQDNTWHYVSAAAVDGGAATLRVDGSQVASFTSNGGGSWNSGSTISDLRPSRDIEFDGELDEIRVANVVRTNQWRDASYRNQATTTDFYTAGMPQEGSVRTFADANVEATGTVFIESGTAVFPTGDFLVGGSFDNDSTFDANGGAIVFNSTTTGHTVAAGNSHFFDLSFDGAAGGWNVTENATATNAINFVDGGSLVVDGGVIIESTGTFFNELDNASTTWTGATLRLSSGSELTINVKENTGDVYGTLNVVNNTSVKSWNSSSDVYSLTASSSLYSQDHSAIDGDLYIFGDYVRGVGTEYWSYATDFDGIDLATTSSERPVNVRVAADSVVTIDGSSFEMIGVPAASSTVAAQSGAFLINLLNASTTMNFYDVSNLDKNGLFIGEGGYVSSLDNGHFQLENVLDVYGFNISSTTIDSNPGLQIFTVGFDMAVPVGAANVAQLDTAPASFWWFRESYGNLGGEANDDDTGDPGSIRWDDSSYLITVSGQVYSDDGSTTAVAPTCDDSTQNVRIVVDGGAFASSTSCSVADGSYSFPGVAYVGDPNIVVYLDTNGGENGSVVTKTPTADILDLDIYINRVMTRHEDIAPLSIADMTVFDESDDSDLRFVATVGATDSLIVRPDTELIVASSTTFIPGGNITLQSGGSGQLYDGSLHLDDGATFVASSTETHLIGGSFFNDVASSFTAASSTFEFTATTTGKGITKFDPGTLVFNELLFTGVGGSWNISADILVEEDMTITNGTVTGTGDITMQAGQLSGDGLLSMGGGTTTIKTSTTLGGVQGWTFYDLVLGDGLSVSTTTRTDLATTTVANKLIIDTAHYLDTGASVWNLSGTGDVFTEDGTLLQDTSTFVYSGGGSVDVLATDYYNLQFGGAAGTPLYTFPTLGVLVENDLIVAGAVASEVNLNTNDPVVAVLGDVSITGSGILSLSNSTDLTISGSYQNDATVNANSGTVVFDSSDAYSIEAGASSFADVSLVGSGAVTLLENATSTGLFQIATTSDFTLSSGAVLAVGGQLSVESTLTDWTGSTLYLYGGGDYLVNSKDLTVDFENLIVAANTEVRTWNTEAVTQNVDAAGSWYSQDHAGADGDLYIFGAYAEDTRSDYWSYATDFDGVDLTGGLERQVDVYFDVDSSALWTGGSISVIGDASASTTLQNQGAGTYGVVVGGDTVADWMFLSVRNINSSGLTFTGSPIVSDFSNTDLLVESNGGSAVTVGGSAITASPARTLSDIVFNSDIGVTGAVNVTATGTTLSGWRFTAHSGNLDGEAEDLDPAGDPGYIIWDDSAAIISISGTVYEADGSTVSSVCDDSTTNIVLSIKGSLAQNASSSCSSADGSYTISGVSFGSLDELMLYIDGESDKGVTVTKDPISSIADADIYENHVIVRHENVTPLSIEDMTVWDSSDDADIPFTAVDAGTDTLTLPSNTKLLIWGGKEFAPAGNITLAGGGAGAAYDGSLEALANASFTTQGSESHSIGGSFEFAATADFEAASSTITFTTDDSGRSITVNDDVFYNAVFNGAGSWSITDTDSTFDNDVTITSGSLTLNNATTSIGGSLANTDTLDTNGGLLHFTAQTGSKTITLGGSDAADVLFAGAASWSISDTNATATGAFTVAMGTVTLPSGVLAVGQDFIVEDTVLHNSGSLALTNSTGETTLTLSGNDLFAVIQTGVATTTMTDASAALLGNLTVLAGEFKVATNTLSIGGSLEASAAVLDTASGTLLFNSDDTGEFVDVGNNDLYNAVFANASGGWAVFGATTTNNFFITTASNFTLVSAETLVVGGVFQNLVGGAATTWSNTTLKLDGANAYSANTKAASGDSYEAVLLGENTDIRFWNSVATTTTVASSSSLYSQDHAAVDGSLYVYGDFAISTSTENWSYSTDFDGVALTGVNKRQVNVFFAENATSTLSTGGTLNVIGETGFPTTVQNQGSGSYTLNVSGGQLDMDYYSIGNLNEAGLNISGSPTISSLSNGEYLVNINGANAITLDQLSLDSNPSFLILNTRFATVLPASTGVNVNLSATSTNSWTFRDETGDIAGEVYDIDGITDCGSIRWDNSSCLLTEQTEYRWRNDDGGIGVPDSEWFDTDWSKRKRVRVANNDNTAYATATVKITVAYDSDMQTDFEDLRFTQSDGVTPIDFWVEDFNSGVSADVWIEVLELDASETVSVFMYYENVSAGSLSSAVNTMISVDDFEDGNITEYSGQNSLFQVDGGSAFGGSFGLELNGANKGTRLNPGIARFDQNFGNTSDSKTIRFMQYIDTSAGPSDEVCTLFAVQSPVTSNLNYGVCLEQFGVDRITLAKNVLSTDNFGTVVQLASSTVTYTTGWYEVEVDWLTDDTINVDLYNPSGVLAASLSTTDSSYSSGGYGFTSWGQNGDWDSYIVRPYMASEPTIFFGTEQVDGGASYTSDQNEPTSAFQIGDTARLRVAIENTGLDITAQEFTLEFAAKGVAPSCAAVSGASYADVPVDASCGASAVCMSTSTVVANGAATSDLLEVGRNTFSAGSFVEDPSNATNPTNLDQNFYTEVEYAIGVTSNAVDQSYCFRVTDAGTSYDSYVNIPELTLKFDPVVGAITLNEGLDISLIPATTTSVYATGTVTDFNGAADLVYATSTIYRSGVAGGAACTPDNNNCYVSNTADSCQFTGCAGNTCEIQCRADIFYHADPTDVGTFDGQEWLAFIEVEDANGGYDFASAIGVELTTLRAIDVVGAIDYGALEVNDDTGSFNASTSIFNYGNVDADLEITGSDLSDGLSSVIPANQQKFATSTFTYSGCGSCELLSSSSPVQIDVDLSKPSVDTPPVTDDVYWGIFVPFGTNSVAHQGINVFTPVSP